MKRENRIVKGLTTDYRLKTKLREENEKKIAELKREGVGTDVIKQSMTSITSASLTSLNKAKILMNRKGGKNLNIRGQTASPKTVNFGARTLRELKVGAEKYRESKRSQM